MRRKKRIRACLNCREVDVREVIVRLDRIVFYSELAIGIALSALSGFRTLDDHARRNLDVSPFEGPPTAGSALSRTIRPSLGYALEDWGNAWK